MSSLRPAVVLWRHIVLEHLLHLICIREPQVKKQLSLGTQGDEAKANITASCELKNSLADRKGGGG